MLALLGWGLEWLKCGLSIRPRRWGQGVVICLNIFVVSRYRVMTWKGTSSNNPDNFSSDGNMCSPPMMRTTGAQMR